MNTSTTATTSTTSIASITSLISQDNPLIDMNFITTYTGMTDKWFYKLIQLGRFPKPIKLGRSSRWFKQEVEVWILEQVKQSRSCI